MIITSHVNTHNNISESIKIVSDIETKKIHCLIAGDGFHNSFHWESEMSSTIF